MFGITTWWLNLTKEEKAKQHHLWRKFGIGLCLFYFLGLVIIIIVGLILYT